MGDSPDFETTVAQKAAGVVKAGMAEKGFSLRVAAREAGVSHDTVRRVAQGLTVSTSALQAVLSVFGTRLSALIADAEKEVSDACA